MAVLCLQIRYELNWDNAILSRMDRYFRPAHIISAIWWVWTVTFLKCPTIQWTSGLGRSISPNCPNLPMGSTCRRRSCWQVFKWVHLWRHRAFQVFLPCNQIVQGRCAYGQILKNRGRQIRSRRRPLSSYHNVRGGILHMGDIDIRGPNWRNRPKADNTTNRLHVYGPWYVHTICLILKTIWVLSKFMRPHNKSVFNALGYSRTKYTSLMDAHWNQTTWRDRICEIDLLPCTSTMGRKEAQSKLQGIRSMCKL